jgi:hypothetical protein
MSEPMTPRFWNNVSLALADDIGMVLITLNHIQLSEPIYVASADVDVVSRGITFLGWPVLVNLPSHGSAPKRGRITLQNVDPRIGRLLRELKSNISVLFEYVSRDVPDEVEWDHGGLFLRNVEVNDILIQGEVVGHGTDPQNFPRTGASPATTPGLYR